MTSPPTVSVCLPVHNGERYLSGAIDSIQAQTFQNFELVIVDDCSTDATWDIANQLALKDSRIRLLRNDQNIGLFRNYNKSMSMATGEFIKLFAHDDLLKPSILERMVSVFKSKPEVALVSTAKEWIDEDGVTLAAKTTIEQMLIKPFGEDTQMSADQAIRRTLSETVNWLGEPCSQMFRRKHSGSGFDPRFVQIGDLDFSYRLLKNGDFYFIADPLCSFRRHSHSNTKKTTRSLKAKLDWFVIAAKYRDLMDQAEISEEAYVTALTQRLAGIIYNVIFTNKTEERAFAIESFLGRGKAVLDRFGGREGTSQRDNLTEFEALAVLALIELANLQNERHLAQHQSNLNESAIDSLRTEIASTKEVRTAEVRELRSALDELGSSLSWKVTAPLRKLNKSVRR